MGQSSHFNCWRCTQQRGASFVTGQAFPLSGGQLYIVSARSRTVACVREAGFLSSVTRTYGLNTLQANPLRIMRLPVEAGQKVEYTAEMLVEFHLRSGP
jgi:hypothetical protein